MYGVVVTVGCTLLLKLGDLGTDYPAAGIRVAFYFGATAVLLALEKVGLGARAEFLDSPGLGAEEAAGWNGLEAGSECRRRPAVVCLARHTGSALPLTLKVSC